MSTYTWHIKYLWIYKKLILCTILPPLVSKKRDYAFDCCAFGIGTKTTCLFAFFLWFFLVCRGYIANLKRWRRGTRYVFWPLVCGLIAIPTTLENSGIEFFESIWHVPRPQHPQRVSLVASQQPLFYQNNWSAARFFDRFPTISHQQSAVRIDTRTISWKWKEIHKTPSCVHLKWKYHIQLPSKALPAPCQSNTA